MEFLFELVFQFFAEFMLQVVFEALAELGLRSVREPFRKPPNPWLAAIGYALFGAVAGGLSLWLFPSLFMQSHSAQVANLVLSPMAAGAVMASIGAWRRRHEQDLMRIDTFAYGYIFALAMGIIRFVFGQ